MIRTVNRTTLAIWRALEPSEKNSWWFDTQKSSLQVWRRSWAVNSQIARCGSVIWTLGFPSVLWEALAMFAPQCQMTSDSQFAEPRGPKDQKNRDFERDWKFRPRMEFSSEPPTAALFCGKIETWRLKFSSEIENFDRDWKFRARLNFFDRWALWELFGLDQSRSIKCSKFGGPDSRECSEFCVHANFPKENPLNSAKTRLAKPCFDNSDAFSELGWPDLQELPRFEIWKSWAKCTKIARFSAVAAAIQFPSESRFCRPQEFPFDQKALPNGDLLCDLP